jgi:predicted dehydrogenase
MKVTRRSFLTKAALATATISWTARSWSQVAGANGDVRVATVGFNGRGGDHIGNLSKTNGVRYTALCDADENVLRSGVSRLSKEGGPQVEGFQDIRKLLDYKNLDVVTIATPNHWHSLAAIWAIQAGKDVYLEKPVSHNVWEGRKVVEAARTHGRIVQTGTQSRSNTGMREAIQYLHDGHLGKIKLVRGLCYKRRPSIGKVDGKQRVPDGVNLDLWCGPAPLNDEPLMRKKFHYDWHWIWATGNGDLGNQGIHQMDISRWALGVDHLSPRVWSVGGRFGYEDDGQTPNTQIVYHDYDKAPLIFEVRGLPSKPVAAGTKETMDDIKGASVGVIIECEGGTMVIGSYSAAVIFDNDGKEVKKFNGGASHYDNFLKAVHSRKHTDLNADILEGHLSSALCHTGNISYLLGKETSTKKVLNKIKSDSYASESFGRMLEHLKINEVDLEKNRATLGPVLSMNPKTERFKGNNKANALLKRNYRKPYVINDMV